MRPWLLVILLFSGCVPCCEIAVSDTGLAGVAARCENRLQNVKCYTNDGKVILDAKTRGVMHYKGGAMVFTDIATGQTVRTTGTCVVSDVGGQP